MIECWYFFYIDLVKHSNCLTAYRKTRIAFFFCVWTEVVRYIFSRKKMQSACTSLTLKRKDMESKHILWTIPRDLQNLLGGHTLCVLIGSFLSNEIPLLLLLLHTDLCLLNSLYIVPLTLESLSHADGSLSIIND